MDIKKRITDEAAMLFYKYGIRAVTMDTIANHLGISKRTIYEHFEDKDELLGEVVKSMAGKQLESFNVIMAESENVIEVVFKIIKTAASHMQAINPTYMMDLKKYHHKVFATICQKSDIRNFEMSLAILERGIKEEVFRSDINIEIVNAGVHSLVDSFRNSDYFPDEKYNRIDIIDNILLNYLRGIATEKGRELVINYRENIINLK